MRMRRCRSIVLAAGLAVMGGPALADMTVYYHAGGWDAFNGPGDNGQPVCGVGSRNPADGRTFSMRFQLGADDVTFIASKPGWNIPGGTQMPVVVQIGLERPWAEQGVGSGQRVQWSLDRNAVQEFDAQFRRAASMTVTFPSGSEQPWVIELNGSTAVSNAMGRCVTDMARQGGAPAQPASAPAPGQGTTQPFGAAPGSPTQAAPSQPGNPANSDQPGNPANSDQSGNQTNPAR